MKKVKTDQPRQTRRQRALARFSIDPIRAAKDPDYATRKAQEKASLQKALSLGASA